MTTLAVVTADAREGEQFRLWGVEDVAACLGMSVTWVKRATASGVLPSIKIGGARRYVPSDIRAYVASLARKGR